MQGNSILFVSNFFYINIIKKKNNYYFFFFSNHFFFLFTFNKNQLFWNFLINYLKLNLYFFLTNLLNNFKKIWCLFFLQKYVIFGRGFKLKKNLNKTNWNFNISNNVLFYSKKTIIQKASKKKILILFNSFCNLNKTKINKIINKIINKNIFLKKLIKLNKHYFFLKKKKQ